MSLVKKEDTNTSVDLQKVLDFNNLPAELSGKYTEILDKLNKDITIPEMFGDVLQETSLGTSVFQDRSFVLNERLTPHRKLRQCVLQLQDRYSSLYAAKSGAQKAKIKVARLEVELSKLKKEIEAMKNDPNVDPDELRLKELDLLEKQVEYQDSLREQKSSLHLVKDALQKVVMYENMAEEYRKEVEDSGIGYDEAEIEFYVMYFTRDLETQLRTMGRPDPGTLQSISHLPKPLRDKMRKNLKFLKEKIIENPKKFEILKNELAKLKSHISQTMKDAELFKEKVRDKEMSIKEYEEHLAYLDELKKKEKILEAEYNRLKKEIDDFEDLSADGDFLYLKYWDVLKPQKTGEGEYEGVNVKEYLTLPPLSVIADNKALKE